MLAEALKTAAIDLVSLGEDAVIVASFGRSGSTLIAHALLDTQSQRRLGGVGERIKRRFLIDCWDLSEGRFCPGRVYKTHDYPEGLSDRRRVRAVFLCGSAQEAALSVARQVERLGDWWWRAHAEHLRVTAERDELFARDALGFEAQCRRWFSFDGAPTLCLRYDDLWDHQEALGEFIGAPVKLPARRARQAKPFAEDVIAAAAAVYGPLDRAIEAMPGCFIAGAEPGADFAAMLND